MGLNKIFAAILPEHEGSPQRFNTLVRRRRPRPRKAIKPYLVSKAKAGEVASPRRPRFALSGLRAPVRSEIGPIGDLTREFRSIIINTEVTTRFFFETLTWTPVGKRSMPTRPVLQAYVYIRII
jgi:hypothetical protein